MEQSTIKTYYLNGFQPSRHQNIDEINETNIYVGASDFDCASKVSDMHVRKNRNKLFIERTRNSIKKFEVFVLAMMFHSLKRIKDTKMAK